MWMDGWVIGCRPGCLSGKCMGESCVMWACSCILVLVVGKQVGLVFMGVSWLLVG